MPYIKIMEEDINPLASFDTIENAVLIFGFDYRDYVTPGEKSDTYEKISDFRLFTSLRNFYSYMVQNQAGILAGGASVNSQLTMPGYRAFVTAYDCLASGLPVIYFPLDDYLNQEAYVELEAPDSEGEGWHKTGEIAVLYDLLSNPSKVDKKPEILRNHLSDDTWENVVKNNYQGANNDQDFIRDALRNALNKQDSEGMYIVRLGDRVSMPFTFITTCGFDTADICSTIISACQTDIVKSDQGTGRIGTRQDFLYLYDIGAKYTPAQVVSNKSNAITSDKAYSENVAMVYPWATYKTNVGEGTVHMPGSYGYLMAYANSIKTNKPWLAIAGINRGYIPSIIKTDYDVTEPYVHAMQGDTITNIGCRVNPIVNFGQNVGTIIFGNRTNFIPGGGEDNISFKSFLNIRLLLIFLHKQAYVASVQHMFEPNDDIVWLSFKQKVNVLLEQMISGRGIKWYKWFKLQPDRLGQIKARILIRPIEAVEAFEITISMTDSDISVTVQGE